MLNEKEKRTFLLVVFGVALVSFVSAVIACLINAITLFADYRIIRSYRQQLDKFPDFYYSIGALLFVVSALGLSYGCVKFFVRKTFIPSLVLASVVLLFVIVSTLVLRFTIPTYGKGELDYNCHTFFQAFYVVVVLPLGITVTLMEGSHLLLRFMTFKKSKEEQLQTVNTKE